MKYPSALLDSVIYLFCLSSCWFPNILSWTKLLVMEHFESSGQENDEMYLSSLSGDTSLLWLLLSLLIHMWFKNNVA